MAITIASTQRTRFSEIIGGAVAVIPGAREQKRNDDVDYEFRQDSSFFYLTGFPEPDAVALIDPSHPSEQFVLFVRPRDREMETWNGYRAGVEGATEIYGADRAFPIDELEEQLKERLIGRDRVFFRSGGEYDDRVLGSLRALHPLHDRFGYTVPHTVIDPTPIVDDLRLRKTAAEVDSMAKAAEISAAGHREAMRFAEPGRAEYQVQAAMEYVFRQAGSPRNGYPSIVASGANATILHYTENDRVMKDGDLLLIDAAAEYGLYSADITRTFPVNGTFTAAQRAVYEVVLAAEKAGIAASAPGSNLRTIHDTARGVLTEGLVALGLLPRSADESLAMHLYREYYMHGTSHWLGLDVHDAGVYQTGEGHLSLEAGMAFTVEPGIYIDSHQSEAEFRLLEYDLDEWTERRFKLGMKRAREIENEERSAAPLIRHPIPEEFRGIGVRIEDDLVVTDTGAHNLTAAVPVEIDAVESLASETSSLP